MKDEEMAEEYIKENCTRWEYDSLSVDDIAKENFLAGLKAGRPQWHDLRKDPNDLPVMETELLCQKYSGRCFVGYYNHADKKFYPYEKGNTYDVVDIVRWADIGIWWNIPTV